MQENKQIFQKDNSRLWKNFKILLLLSAVLLVILIGVGIYSVSNTERWFIPKHLGEAALVKIALRDTLDKSVSIEFHDNIASVRAKHRSDSLVDLHSTDMVELKTRFPVRAGFFVNWDIQSFESLQKHVGQMNMVLPEWLFVQDSSDEVMADMSPTALKALELMKLHRISVVPMVSNYFHQKWNGDNVKRIIHDNDRKNKFISSVINFLDKYHLQGVNIDFEELRENSDEYLNSFQQDLAKALHEKGYILTQDVAPFNEDYNYTELAKSNDLIFLMTYDQHNVASVAGPVCAYNWVERALEEATKDIPSSKIIMCIAAYGYDWPKGFQGTDITYEEAISLAAENDTLPHFDNHNYNLSFRYWDDQHLEHNVFFTDALTDFNLIRASHDFGTSGTAIWRLGSEDERIWAFYNNNLSFESLKKEKYRYKAQETIAAPDNVDYVGEGEILNIASSPSIGVVTTEYDTLDHLIAEQTYKSLPTGYVIKKSGVKPKKIVLSFDDGPDDVYTNQIIDILEQYKVPATFFVLGSNVQTNLKTFKRLWSGGYEIGNHTYTHANLEQVGYERTLVELRSTRRVIEAITGHSTILFRPPYTIDAEPTTYNELKPLAIGRNENYLYVGSSIDTRDWEENVSADTIAARAISQKDKGNIILMHDAGGNREATVKALPEIIKYYLANGYQFTTVSDLIDKPKSELMPAVKKRKDTLISQLNEVAITLAFYTEAGIKLIFFIALFLTALRMIVIAVLAIKKQLAMKNVTAEEAVNETIMVSVIVPAFNEEINIVRTVNSLLKLSYTNFEVIVVDDGSKDLTMERLNQNFAVNGRIKILSKRNGGKADALNHGVRHASGELLFCIDADTQVEESALLKMVKSFKDEKVAAIAGNVKIGNKVNLLTNWQSIEYTTGQNFDRMAFDLLNSIMVVPGAIGMFRKSHVIEVGGFTTDTVAEDCDLTLRLLASGYKVKTSNDALAFTEAPETVEAFMKQRRRWSYGIMQSFWKHRKLLFNRKKANLGWVVLPNMLLFQMLLPIFNPLVDAVLILSLVFGKTLIVLGLYLAFTIIDMLIATIAYSFEGEKIKLKTLLMMIPQRIIYRQMYFVILLKSYAKILRGELQNWGILSRTGNVKFGDDIAEKALQDE